MIGYANERKQFDQTIGDFQMVQQMIADSVIEINAARLMVLRAAWKIDAGATHVTGSRWSRSTPPKRWAASSTAASRCYGGMGYSRGAAHRATIPRCALYRIFDGTSEIHRRVVAKSAMKNGAALWDIAG